jgi:hypothetical protein
VVEWVYLVDLTQEGASLGCDIYNGEKLCGDLLVVHQRNCTLDKIETFSHLASDETFKLWVKLCNLCRV